MSDESPDRKLGPLRALREEETALITKLVTGTSFEHEVLGRIADARVQDMPDGGMGGIKFSKRAEKQRFGTQIAEGAFQDADGVPVSVTLNLDEGGDLFELDVFKADSSPLIRYPNSDDLRIIKRHGKLRYAPSQS